MNIKITADSTVDLNLETLNKYDITLSPLTITLDGKTYLDTIDITPDGIYAAVSAGSDIPKTSSINIGEYIEFFNQFKHYDTVIHFNLGSDFSSSHQNAYLASQECQNVTVIDTQNLSTGSGHLVIKAAEMVEEGHTSQEIVDHIHGMIEKVDASFVLDSLEYIRKGGRVNSLVESSATKLKLHPMISVIEGKMKVGKLYRGSQERALKKYTDDILKHKEALNSERVIITHSGMDNVLIQEVYNQIKETNYFDEILITRAGCTISCHCGPNTLGVLTVYK